MLGRTYRPDDKKGHPTGPLIPSDWSAVHNLHPNSRMADYRRVNSPAVPLLAAFNRAYTGVLAGVQGASSGTAGLFTRR